ncbi:MAG TPA: HAD-IA family hydrolase [Solirubrobacteraceae bacterium]|nr:HAD-IA family hydrolase [Solirubrobacteraceae bacterium]
MRFAAVLSDLDGVLVDSGAEVERVWREWAVSRELDPDAVVRAMHGVPARHVIARVAPHLDPVTEAEHVDRLHAATGGDALPGAAELLARASPLAVVTACSPPLAAARFTAAGLAAPVVLITSDRTERGKPHPDPYVAAAAALGVAPGNCLVIEDAPAGVEAGLAAGAEVWAVATTHARSELSAAARVVPDLWAVLDGLGLRSRTAAG